MQSELAAPCGWINMWAGRNKKTYEHQRLSQGLVLVLRVNKRLYRTLPFVFALENVPFTHHSNAMAPGGMFGNRRKDLSFTLKCFMDSSITQNYPAKIAKINKEVPELCIQCFEVMCDASMQVKEETGFLIGPVPVVLPAAPRW